MTCFQIEGLRNEFLRYCLAGGIAYCADFLTLYLLTEHLHIYYLASASAGFCVGMLIVYRISVRWVFADRSVDDRRHEFALFVLIGMAGLAINNLSMFLLTEVVGLFYLLSKLAAAALVLTFNYGARRHFLFSAPRQLP